MSDWHEVLEQLVTQRYQRLVTRARMLVGPDEAEDLVQDALISTFTSRARCRSVPEAEQYVRLTMASRSVDRARSRIRSQKALHRAAVLEPSTDSAPPATDSLDDDVLTALAALTPRQRACVTLRFLDDQSVRQTATTLRISEGAVKRYTAEAVAALGPRLEATFNESVTIGGA